MASQTLIDFNAFVNSLTVLSMYQNARLKEVGERLYVSTIKEEALHIRKHLLAVKTEDPTKAALADFWNAVLQRVIDEDAKLTMETAGSL